MSQYLRMDSGGACKPCSATTACLAWLLRKPWNSMWYVASARSSCATLRAVAEPDSSPSATAPGLVIIRRCSGRLGPPAFLKGRGLRELQIPKIITLLSKRGCSLLQG